MQRVGLSYSKRLHTVRIPDACMNFTVKEIDSGERGTDETVKVVAQVVNASLRRPNLRFFTQAILDRSRSRSHSDRDDAHAIYNFVRSCIRYTKDPIGVETVQDPETTIKVRHGDCDDHSALIAGMAMSIGIPARLKVIGIDRDSFSHIFAELLVDGEWIAADTTTKMRREFGWQPPKMGEQKIYPLTGVSKMIAGLNVYPKVPRDTMRVAVRNSVWSTLSKNWENGLINRGDVAGYLKVIDDNNAPFGNNTFFKPVVREAISDYLRYVDNSGIRSNKSPGQISGLEGLDGFLSSIWKGVVGVAGTVVSAVTGGGQKEVVVKVDPATGAISADVQAKLSEISESLKSTAKSTGSWFEQNPWALPVIIGGGVLALVLVMKK